ncbi:MAG TPA: ELWxxDGT repeat protein [Thermoanaerobaculia bacterium]|nr:ELWxxDGT repeat protein [Thermoanaerobaculia bacterium]
MRTCSLLPLTILGLLAVPPAQAQPAHLVADLNTTVPQHPAFIYTFQQLTALGNAFFFVADEGAYGAEVWRSDGTLAGTRLLKDVCPGSCPSNPSSLTVSNGSLFFTADDGTHGRELWKSDGTTAGTVMVADISPGRSDSISGLVDAGGVLFFFTDDGVHGSELWTSNGTAAGTHLVKDVFPGVNGVYGRILATSGQQVLLALGDALHGVEPWISDGTEAGTVMVASLRPSGDAIEPFYDPLVSGWDAAPAPQGGFLFAADDGTGTALWVTDGTPGGTVRLSNAASPHEMKVFHGVVYFAASDAATGVELWKSDGTAGGTVRVKDLQAGAGSSDPRELTVAGNQLFFRASDGAHGAELWKSDGTAAGTLQVADLNPGAGDAFPFTPGNVSYRYQLSALGTDLIFFAYDGSSTLQLWRTNGTTTTKLSTAGFPDHIVHFDKDFVALGSRVQFLAGRWGTEVWSSDGTAAGTQRLADVVTSTSSLELISGKTFFHDFAALGNLLLFPATNGSPLIQPWKTDGTPGGTSQVASLPIDESHPYGIHPLNGGVVFFTNLGIWASDGTAGGTRELGTGFPFSSLPSLGGSLYYIAFDSGSGQERLWKTNGTPAGTFPLMFLSSFDDGGNMVTSGGKIFMPGSDNGSGYSLWVTDGTAPGTLNISGLAHGQDFNGFGRLVDMGGGTILFTAFEIGYVWELWRSDGTAAGTTLLKASQNFNGRDRTVSGVAAGPVGGLLFFVLGDDEAGAELWKSDGTAAGTVRVADIAPGPLSSNPHALTLVGNKLYFVADDGVHGDELWVSDGTAAGTRMVVDLLAGPDSSRPDSLAAVGNTLLFSAFDGVHGVEPWRTGGTPVSTRMIQDIAPGSLSSSPTSFTAAGSNVYFAANDNTAGFELWAVPQTNVLATFGDVPTDYWSWSFIEAIAAAGLTGGCAQGLYCPANPVSRGEMAVFLERGIRGAQFAPPPATGTVFTDVPASYWSAAWIEQLAADGITRGCAAGQFCPDSAVNRAEMAVFLLRARHGSSYTPPAVAATRFTDVPASYWAAAWIEQLAAEGITGGCGSGNYCPDSVVWRDQMAVFLTRTFHLTVP